jgi:uncharacterized metal-binding protein YceD (DUF177 family)
MDGEPIAPEFSRPYRLSELEPQGDAVELEATAEERAALARRFGLPAVDRLVASLDLQRDARAKKFLVRGELQADLTQICVVTLEPFAETVSESFAARFVRDAPAASAATEVFVDLADGEPPEPVAGDSVDLGELVAQYLLLAMNPHPRRPGAEFAPGEPAQAPEEEERKSPFAALAMLRGGKPT